ncbi:MAG TPA: S1 RNA-binding domain-containing protein [Candidatus Avidehalobacter gallistercoris]|uniref:S1 RNA-binding domain-containing protein n=1 Tax=Candidatus Avidehalobacter gallistercoris TaxID=2840694 RepID=A0A9D1HJM1_9FIRM|nr:S1 RNA-binding domain-containing protein [Candidatus Avidehalobacter gallistercoris]
MTIAEGDICTGVVTGITKFGAFVKLDEQTTGLVHISEVADTYVKEVADFISVGDEVKVKVLSLNADGKIGLSIKKAVTPPRDNAAKNERFENKLAEFMRNSNEKLSQLKKHQEGRRR